MEWVATIEDVVAQVRAPTGPMGSPWPPRAPQTPVVPEPYWSPWSPTEPEPRGSPWPPTQTPCPQKGPYPGVPAPLGCPGMLWGAFPLLQPLQPCPLGFFWGTQRTVTLLSQLLSPKVRTSPSLRSPTAIWGTRWPPAPHLPPAGNGEPRSCLRLGGALQLGAPPRTVGPSSISPGTTKPHVGHSWIHDPQHPPSTLGMGAWGQIRTLASPRVSGGWVVTGVGA